MQRLHSLPILNNRFQNYFKNRLYCFWMFITINISAIVYYLACYVSFWPRYHYFQCSLILSSNVLSYSVCPKVLYHRFIRICPFSNNNYSPHHYTHSISIALPHPFFFSETSFMDLQRTLSHSKLEHFLSCVYPHNSSIPHSAAAFFIPSFICL